MNRLFAALVAAPALWIAACSSGGNTIAPPPPAGKYSASSLNGTYAFVTSGEAITSGATSATPFSRTGSFTANGSGGIQGGVYDVVNAGGSSTASSAPIPITGGSYTVNADGRGTLTFNVTSSGAPATIAFGIVLTSTSGGFMMDQTASGNQASTGSGNFVLQNSSAFAAGVSGSYVFDFTGLDGTTNPQSLVGRFAASGGVITTGLEDSNDNGALTSSTSITGSFVADPANTAAGRGTATIEGQTYAFYIVDSTRVRFISINSSGTGPMLSGDAAAQSGGTPPPSPSGSFVFLVSGSSANGGLTRVGRLTASGGSLGNMIMDVNNGGTQNEFGSGSLSMGALSYDATTGRGTLSFQSSITSVYSFVFYLSSASSGVIQEVSGTPGTGIATVVADGSIAAQSGSPFTSSNISGPYAISWSGLVTSGGSFGSQDEEDFLGQANVSNLSLSGTSDIFQFTGVTLNTNIGTSGQIAINGDGTSNNTMNVSLSQVTPIHMVVYVVSPQLAFFANRDNNGAMRIVAGVLEAQQ
ncbi:MAG TPA: hypothetical protein VHM93_07180 [Candidatus Acidoferrum sp.]|jgi:hypothetical protein|nr:hypothetical protein [Candidatus Acidoferrum sp.]